MSGADFSFYKHQLSASLNYNKVENVFERLEGTTGKIYGEWINTYSPNTPSFLKLLFECTWNKLISENGNFSARTKFGVSTNNFSPFAPFVIDGFLNIRGIGNRVDRGTASFILNAEYRQSFWKHKYFTLQAAAFVDYGTLRSPGDNYDGYFPMSEGNIFTGVGIRAHLNVFYKTCLRLDYSISPVDATQRGFTYGFGQFF